LPLRVRWRAEEPNRSLAEEVDPVADRPFGRRLAGQFRQVPEDLGEVAEGLGIVASTP